MMLLTGKATGPVAALLCAERPRRWVAWRQGERRRPAHGQVL